MRPSPSSAIGASPPPSSASTAALAPYFGSYSSGADVLVIARLGWYFDMADGTYRTIYATGSPNHFTIGERFQEPLPKFADLIFTADLLTVSNSAGSRQARRVAYRQTDVTIAAAGAVLAGTVTEPRTTSPHPGIVIVHGAERGERYFYDIWVGVYASLGVAVLTYDKRGIGSSTGVYPGEHPSEDALSTYAGDAAEALRFLASWPGVDSTRVGFHGGSQGGWTVPLAMRLEKNAHFAILASAPATTVGQADLWAGFSNGGTTKPTESTDQMLAAVRATHDGYDPAPVLQTLRAPVLWLLGTNDRTIPTAVCMEILVGLARPNFSVQTFPTGHALLINPTGLLADDARSAGLPPDLYPKIRDWIAQSIG